MSAKPVLPTADAVLQPTLEAMYEARPSTFQFLDLRNGVYWHPFLGFRAQAAKTLSRVADLVGANRLASATGDDLRDYVSSEFAPLVFADRTTAVGEVVLVRTSSTTSGDIPAGTRIARTQTDTDPVPLKGAQYKTLVDYHVDVGQLTTDPIPVQAVSDGSDSNHPTVVPAPTLQVAPGQTLFDTFIVGSFSAAGGSEGPDDPYIRRYAKAFAIGQFGPTGGESYYGALQASGARNILVFDDPGTGTQKILAADVSWASSAQWTASVQQYLYDNDLVGFGCKVIVTSVVNKIIAVYPTITVRDPKYLADTSDITQAVQQVVADYFDLRLDWNAWNTEALQAAITRAHPKILVCTGVTVKDPTGATVPEVVTPDFTQQQYHYYLANNAVKPTYQVPS